MLLIFLLCLTSSFIYEAAAMLRNNRDFEEIFCTRRSDDARSTHFESFGSTWYIEFSHDGIDDRVLISVKRRRMPLMKKIYLDEDVYLSLHLKKTDGTETTLIQRQIVHPDDDHFISHTSINCSECDSPAFRDAPVRCKNFTVTVNLWAGKWKKDECASCFKTPLKATSDGSKSRDGLESTSTLLKNLEDLLMTGDDQDVVFNVRYREFKAHRSILRARSPVFADLFRRAEKDRSNGSISIVDCEPESFDDFLRFVYTGKLEDQTPARLMSLFYLAEKYEIPSLKRTCVDTLKTSLSIIIVSDVISFATKHNETGLLQSAETFFSKHMEEIMATEEWQRFLESYPSQANALCLKTVKTYYKKID